MATQTRQEFIKAAVAFLQNPSFINSPLDDKLKFLKDKGLNQVEVDEALNLALIHRNQSQNGRWNFLLVLGICLGGYKLYKIYSESINSCSAQTNENGARQSTKSSYVESQQDKTAATLDEILKKMAELKVQLEHQRTNTQADIQSLKTLLLSHEKFAAPPVIPEWQLKKVEKKD